jgi:hypothetical protein
MTKYEILYGVTVDEFPNERENVKKKLRLARGRRAKVYKKAYSFEQQTELHEINEAIRWAEKILRDIDE